MNAPRAPLSLRWRLLVRFVLVWGQRPRPSSIVPPKAVETACVGAVRILVPGNQAMQRWAHRTGLPAWPADWRHPPGAWPFLFLSP